MGARALERALMLTINQTPMGLGGRFCRKIPRCGMVSSESEP